MKQSEDKLFFNFDVWCERVQEELNKKLPNIKSLTIEPDFAADSYHKGITAKEFADELIFKLQKKITLKSIDAVLTKHKGKMVGLLFKTNDEYSNLVLGPDVEMDEFLMVLGETMKKLEDAIKDQNKDQPST